jgi:hypothetical protein
MSANWKITWLLRRTLFGRVAPFADATVAHRLVTTRLRRLRLSSGRRQCPLYPIVWPNNDGNYPWNPHATKEFKDWQPVLGVVPKTT